MFEGTAPDDPVFALENLDGVDIAIPDFWGTAGRFLAPELKGLLEAKLELEKDTFPRILWSLSEM